MKKTVLFLSLLCSQWVGAQQRGAYVVSDNGASIAPPPQEKRYALVIGNNAYQYIGKLRNAVSDATLMTSTLRSVGFEVETITNGTRSEMVAALRRLGKKAAGQHTVALFYYSGHGLQVRDENWLVPVDALAESPADVADACVGLSSVTSQLEQAKTGTNLVVLDACRNNPFPYGRNAGGGLTAPKNVPSGTYIAFSTAPNTTAADGSGGNSPYTLALSKAMQIPNLEIEKAFKRIRVEVKATGQTPWENSSLEGEFYFKPVQVVPVAPTVQPTPQYQPPAPRVEPAPVPAKPLVPANMLLIAAPTSAYKMGNVFDAKEGSDNETTHSVSLKPFVMDKYETTFAEYDAFCDATGKTKPSDEDWGRGSHPVLNVSWFDACEYANWRSRQAGKTPCYTISGEKVTCNWSANGFRLPTEAEWEYAASWNPNTNTKTRFGNGKDIADPAEMNFNGSNDSKKDFSVVGEFRFKTLPVGSFAPNGHGLYDMAGNLWEWCWDWYGTYDNATGKPIDNPTGAVTGSYRVYRGGSRGGDPGGCRAACRNADAPAYRDPYLGFRLVALL
jgi:formylglycine-generating enzyme required for sulfatase activity